MRGRRCSLGRQNLALAIVRIDREEVVLIDAFPRLQSGQLDDLRGGRELLLLDVGQALIDTFRFAFALFLSCIAIPLVSEAFHDWTR